MSEIVLDGLSFCYPGAVENTLDNLDLQINAGEAHALLGGSGAGKSTLLNLLSGLLRVQSGRMLFDGLDVGQVAPHERRVSQVFQFPVLYEALTVEENLAFPLRNLKDSVSGKRGRVDELARRLKIDHLLSRGSKNLSLFEKQLVAIGKSLVRPDVALVLLDEPLTAAEPVHKWELRQTLKSLQREMGATMIYVTHDQTEALTFADRISVLHDGKILQTGSPQSLVDLPAHEHVGYFVGTPGMNLLDSEISAGFYQLAGSQLAQTDSVPGPCRVGFRPEHCELSNVRPTDREAVAVEILGKRTLGTLRQEQIGLALARLGTSEITSRQTLSNLSEGRGWLTVDPTRVLGFRDGWRIGERA